MRKIIFLVLILVVCVAAAMAFMSQRDERVWTTSSVAAAREFDLGMAAEMKFYSAEAKKHFDRAAALDPKFRLARIKSTQYSAPGPRRRDLIVAELNRAKGERLSDRERMLVDISLARVARDPVRAKVVLDGYLDEHPNDSYALNLGCGDAWDRKDFEAASKCYNKLLEKDPNWVNAQNNLGYIAMAQGRFDDAEESFKMYRYIAPDQANPHDSLGELYTVIGRYDDAERELRKALEVRNDFCASYHHLILLYSLTDRPQDAAKIAETMKKYPVCANDRTHVIECSMNLWHFANRGQWADAVTTSKKYDCLGKTGDADVISHRAALHVGDEAMAIEIETKVRAMVEKNKRPDGTVNDALLNHILGVRALFAGNHEEAISLLQTTDDKLVYWGDGEAMFKLFNLATLRGALEKAGRNEEADKLRQRIESINPHFMSSTSARLVR